MNILVVDDEEAYRMLLRNYLMSNGWDVFVAEDGEDALEKMSRIKIDVVVSDVYMPVMDGIKLHKTVRGIPGYERTPFLFVSAYDDEYTLESVKDPNIDGFLKKGRPVTELKNWVQYLTTPEDQRPKLLREQVPKSSLHDRHGRKR